MKILLWLGLDLLDLIVGVFLIYAGLESKAIKCPSKFDIDKLDWSNYDWQQILTELVSLKKRIVGNFTIITARPVITAIYYDPPTGDGLFGIFNVSSNSPDDFFKCNLPDGVYHSEITHTDVIINKGNSRIPKSFDIISFQKILSLQITPLESVFF